MTDLNDKRRRFAEEYLVDLNATQAAIRAGYSERSAYSQGQRLLKDAEIAALIADLKAARSCRTEITADNVLREWARIGFSDIRRVFSPGGAVIMPTDLDDDAAAALASVEVVTRRLPSGDGEGAEVEYVHKFRMHDKLGALSKLGDHLGIAVKRHELSGPNGGPVETHDLGAEVATLPKDKRDALRLAIKAAMSGDQG